MEGQPSENLLHIIDVAAHANFNACPKIPTHTQTHATLIRNVLVHLHPHTLIHKQGHSHAHTWRQAGRMSN